MLNEGLQEESLKLMSPKQRAIVETQWKRHQHEDTVADYDVSGEGDMLEGFRVNKGVWNPFLASGRYHARYLFYHTDLFHGKTVIELGSGTGLMGVVMARYGARNVIMSDISPAAVENSRENVQRYGLEHKVSVVQGDLFENIHEKGDLITWMIPFFHGTPPKGDSISASMIMPPSMLERFLDESRSYLADDGVVLIPSFRLGGQFSDPEGLSKKYGYAAKMGWSHSSVNGIQQGMLYMHELRRRER